MRRRAAGATRSLADVQWVGYLPFVLLIVAFLFLTTRNRRRQALAEQERVARIRVGTEVMTTAGLYGTVVALDGDGTATLAIAPGVEVRWATAALRDATSLSSAYRKPIETPVSLAKDGEGRSSRPPAGG